MKFVKKNKILIIIISIGIFVRLFFSLWLSDFYFSKETFYFIDSDTGSWMNSFINLINDGQYTVRSTLEYGYFIRMPGYSFFLGFFWLLSGKDIALAYLLVAIVQITMDIFSISLFYLISKKLFNSKQIAFFSSFLYATYPFIIVWNPVIYSESPSVFLMLLSIYFFISDKKYKYYYSGIFISLGILFRPQISILLPLFFLFLFITHKKELKVFLVKSIQIGLMVVLVYGPWPARNYINHGKIIFTQDLRGAWNWGEDVISFMQYIYSVKSEWEPQFSSILKNENVTFPNDAYISKEDSLKLERAIFLCKTCGKGFSHWSGHWKGPITFEEDCSKEISRLFSELRQNQIKNNPINFYILVPLSNLKKAVFKSSLNESENSYKKYASLLFYFRSLLILAGFIGCLLLVNNNKYWILFLLFPLILYISLCFGTGVQFRNIEIRYFIHADILLLFPAAYLFHLLFKSISLHKN